MLLFPCLRSSKNLVSVGIPLCRHFMYQLTQSTTHGVNFLHIKCHLIDLPMAESLSLSRSFSLFILSAVLLNSLQACRNVHVPRKGERGEKLKFFITCAHVDFD